MIEDMRCFVSRSDCAQRHLQHNKGDKRRDQGQENVLEHVLPIERVVETGALSAIMECCATLLHFVTEVKQVGSMQYLKREIILPCVLRLDPEYSI